MKRIRYFPFILLCLCLLILLSLPKSIAIRLQALTAAWISPILTLFDSETTSQLQEQKFFLDQKILEQEILSLKEIYLEELRILMNLKSSLDPLLLDDILDIFQKNKRREFQQLILDRLQALPAKVIFRTPSSWNNSLWINVGLSQNEALGKTVIGKNSPVLVDFSVVGVIDYVGHKQSRVRLITDSALTPSVRVSRGSSQGHNIWNLLTALYDEILSHKEVFCSETTFSDLLKALEAAKKEIKKEGKTYLLAKGEIQGSGSPLWKRDQQLLKGTGFNYDFSDEEGPARDLRTGHPQNSLEDHLAMPLIQPHDLLVTTGMDGVFPKGLLVAEVTQVLPLKEGDFFYNIYAKPTCGNLYDISHVFVLPPLGFDMQKN